MTRKSLILLLAAAALIVTGAFAVMAQDDNTNPTPFGPGWMHQWDNEAYGMGMMRGHGMMMGGWQSMMWDDEESMMTAVADALGLDPDAFLAALRDGQTLVEIAEAQNVPLETVNDAMVSQAEEHMATLVEQGYFTQEQVDEHLTWMRDNIAEMPMFSNDGYGSFMGEHPHVGPGMMGHRHGW